MKKSWIAPTEIYVPEVLNNRVLNHNYIGDVTESMIDKGFLPEFPIDVFRSENLANVDTDLPFSCACGAHRTFSAINAKLEKVLVHIHDGREEDFIELMHLDNFQFDPAVNTGIGQPFTNKEKRSAVTQLLLLPKFFEQTNAALNELWNIPETNIRRWRSEVVELLETDSPKLRLWAVSEGRLARLRELAASTERKDAEGKIVNIRKPYVDASDDEKEAFWDVIEDDALELGLDWNDIQLHVREKFSAESRWRIYEDLTMKQLQSVHQLILSKDKLFLEAVKGTVAAEAERKAKAEALEKAIDTLNQVFKKAYAPQEDKYSPAYKEMKSRFEGFVQKRDERFKNFFMDSYDYDYDFRKSPESAEVALLHDEIAEDIKSEAEWLKDFMEAEEKALSKQRKSCESDWLKQRKALLTALAEYPRPIEERILLYQCDENILYDNLGTLEKLLSTEAPSAKKFTATIKAEADGFKRSANAISKDFDYIAEIPEPKPMIESLKEAHGIVPEEPEYTVTAEDLHSMPLDEICEHVQGRVVYIPVDDENEVTQQLATILGKASRGQIGTQLHLLMEYALFLLPKSDIEGDMIEHEAPPNGGK